jgi:hypothetical protein
MLRLVAVLSRPVVVARAIIISRLHLAQQAHHDKCATCKAAGGKAAGCLTKIH